MVGVPAHLVDGKQMAFVSLLVLAGIGKGAFVDFAFLGAYQE